MLGVYLLITAAVITAGAFIVKRLSVLCDDFMCHYQDFNRYMDNRVRVGSCK